MKKIFFCVMFLCGVSNLFAQTVSGVVTDKETGETLIGVGVMIKGTSIGASTDLDGQYLINGIKEGDVIEVSYISYKSVVTMPLSFNKSDSLSLNFELEPDLMSLEAATIIVRQSKEGEGILRSTRKLSSSALENLGASEMSIKGISSAEDGLKKMTGVTIGEAGHVYVRGLGDRYSITTLNGLPIASPNPDNKLVPLDLFPSSVVENITVSKVYNAESYADYSGAHIDINTKNTVVEDFANIYLSVGSNLKTTFRDFYVSDRSSLFATPSLPDGIREMSPSKFNEYIKSNDPFGKSFSISKSSALPDLEMSFGMGKSWTMGENDDRLSVLLSFSGKNSRESQLGAFKKDLTAQGEVLNSFDIDSYLTELKIAALGSVGYDFGLNNSINYSLFYARNVEDTYKRREGFDSEGIDLIGSNSVQHIYSLLNNQLTGNYYFIPEQLSIDWSGSFGMTRSSEPDRRQVMFRKTDSGLKLFKLNRQETNRFYGELNENEILGSVFLTYKFGEDLKNFMKVGGAYKNKYRDYSATNFYYNLNNIDTYIDNIYDTDSYLNQENLTSGQISIVKDAQPRSQYFANNSIISAFAEIDYHIWNKLLINLGVRMEDSKQSVRYWTDAAIEELSELNKLDFFPALNIKFDVEKDHAMRFAFSRTVTRPSFIEMSPFLYSESYGTQEIRGNEDLTNGYNWNIDLRYEFFSNKNNDMISVGAYYKYLTTPIERVQETSGGGVIHTFRNADNGMATGLEFELKKQLYKGLRLGFNASYIFTSVILPTNSGIYTDEQRQLQGASPYIVNADLSYAFSTNQNSKLVFTLLYNLQGPRIHAVGIYGMSNVIQEEVHSLDFVTNYNINDNWSIKLQCDNLLNTKYVFTQEVEVIDDNEITEFYQPGIRASIGVKYNF